MEELKGENGQIIFHRRKRPGSWMNKLADEYGIEVETVLDFYNSIKTHRKERTEKFFRSYFEGRNEDGNLDR